jgi:hypothetical protein
MESYSYQVDFELKIGKVGGSTPPLATKLLVEWI